MLNIQNNDVKVEEPKIYQKEKFVFVVYGKKGEGKTSTAMSLVGNNQTVGCISFDGMSQIIQQNFFPEMKADFYNAMRYKEITIERIGNKVIPVASVANACKNSYELFNYMENMKEYDWIIVDGLNILERMVEGLMREAEGKQYSDGIINPMAWRRRNDSINAVFDYALSKARIGVIYTVYTSDKILKENGIETDIIELPHYVGDVAYKSHVVIRTKVRNDKDGRRYICIIDSSKIKNIKSGDEIDITNKRLCDFIKW